MSEEVNKRGTRREGGREGGKDGGRVNKAYIVAVDKERRPRDVLE